MVLFLGKYRGGGATRIFTNWKSNADITEDSYDVEFHTRGAGGNYGLAARVDLAKSEGYIRLDGTSGDYLELRVQDNLTALADFEIKVKGHLGE